MYDTLIVSNDLLKSPNLRLDEPAYTGSRQIGNSICKSDVFVITKAKQMGINESRNVANQTTKLSLLSTPKPKVCITHIDDRIE